MTPVSRGRSSWLAIVVVVVIASLAPLVFTDFFVSVILTKALWLGVAAASLIFLSAYGGMVSLAQVGLYGIAGMTFANLVAADGGLAAAWGPWPATIAALVVATAVGIGFGGVLGGTIISLQPGNDTAFLLNSLIVVIIGGMGSLGGAAIGALALGLVDSYADVYLVFGDHDLTNYSILLTFALLVVVLAVRPLGLFGRPA